MSLRGAKGTEVAGLCLQLLKLHKRLFLFPVLANICKYILLICVIWPLVYNAEKLSMLHKLGTSHMMIILVAFLLLLFALHLILYFFDTAIAANILYYCHNRRDSSIRYGLKQAICNYPRILAWAVYVGTFGLVINLIPRLNNSPFLKKVRDLLQNNHWSIATYFALTAIIDQKLWPFQALKVSATLIHNNWGERLRPTFSFAGKFVLARLIGLIPVIVGAIYGDHTVLIITGAITIVIWSLISTIMHMINNCIRIIGYVYAQYGTATPPFEQKNIANFYKTRTF